MLRTALGPAISGYLEDPSIVEVMLNPDGRLWIDRLSGGLEDTGRRVAPEDAERIVRLVAHHVGVEVHAGSPRVSAELPETGERFEGLVPPVAAAPCFAIRRPAVAVFTLGDYVEAGIMSGPQAELLRAGVRDRKNILVAGGTSTGKTTLVNALLAEVAKTGDRVVLIEDTRELQCAAPNLVALRTKDGAASLSDLVRSSLRLRPDRIPIGEVRGAEALDLLKAWGTGHPGGVGTLHAGSAIGALRRLEQLIQEAVVIVPRALIAETIDLIAVLSGRGSARRLADLAAVQGRSHRRLHPHPRRRTLMLLTRARRAFVTASTFAFVALVTAPAYAAGSNMPWEQPLTQILDSVQGPVAKVISVIIIVITGLTLAFGETSGGFRRLIQIVFGLSIAFAASSFFLSFFQFGGGVLV
jgi:type IV secretion system protein TrbB